MHTLARNRGTARPEKQTSGRSLPTGALSLPLVEFPVRERVPDRRGHQSVFSTMCAISFEIVSFISFR